MREQRATHVPPRASRTTDQYFPHPADDEDDERYYTERLPTSARRYIDTHGNQVIQQGNKRIVIHEAPPPKKRSTHWLVYVGLGMLVMLLLWGGLSWLINWWTLHQIDSTYGMPRTYQTDQVVGHGDSSDHPTHFIFENLNRHVIIIELPGGDVSHARIYSGPTLFSDNGELIPVTGEFKDVNGDGKVDMIVVIQDQRLVYLNDGTQFKPQ